MVCNDQCLTPPDCLVLLVYKDKSKKVQGNKERANVTLEEICGLEAGQWYEGVAFTLTILCLNQAAILGFDSRDALQAWDIRLRYSLGEGTTLGFYNYETSLLRHITTMSGSQFFFQQTFEHRIMYFCPSHNVLLRLSVLKKKTVCYRWPHYTFLLSMSYDNEAGVIES